MLGIFRGKVSNMPDETATKWGVILYPHLVTWPETRHSRDHNGSPARRFIGVPPRAAFGDPRKIRIKSRGRGAARFARLSEGLWTAECTLALLAPIDRDSAAPFGRLGPNSSIV